MAAFRDDMPLIVGMNEDWDENTTRAQIGRPDWDFSPLRMKTMHHLPHIFFDTLRPERPDCPVLVPSSFSVSRDKVIAQDIYSYEPCGLPTGNFMPAEKAQIRLMTASPITLRACIPAPDQVTPEQAYFKDLDFYKKTLFHMPFLSKRIIRYVALYSMAGVAMESRLFRIHHLSQVMPSGCNFRRVAQPPANQVAVPDRPSASDYQEEQESIDPEEMRMAVTAPVFQPYRGATGRAWVAKEYGLSLDTSSLISSGTERDDTDEEVFSFDLGPEPYDPSSHERLPSDEWLDDHQQGLHPGSSEPKHYPYAKFKAMPNKPSIIDMMRNDMEEDEQVPPPSPERALTPTIGWDYDYTRDEPPVVQRITETQRQSTPRPDPPTLSSCPGSALQPPRPRASSVPPTPKPAKRMALHYLPVTEEITPPITPPRAQALEQNTIEDTSPVQKPGRSRGRGKWRPPQKIAPGVGTRSRTRLAEIEKLEASQAQAARAEWPPNPDTTKDIQRLTRELRLCDVPRDAHKELQRVLPSFDEEEIHPSHQPPAAGLMTQHQDVYYIPPPRVVGGVRGNSAPVSTATLGSSTDRIHLLRRSCARTPAP